MAGDEFYRNRATAAGLLALLLAFAAGDAHARCVEAWTHGLKESHNQRRTTFSRNEMFVVCVRLSHEAYVTIWDSPPNADYHKLYPNQFSHKNYENVRAERLSKGTHCFGTPENFPLYFPPDHGLGEGKLQITVTADQAHQPGRDEFSIPGKTVDRSRMEAKTRSYGLGGSCGRDINEYIIYRIQP